MESVSLTVGAIALASLLSTCIECIDYITAVRSFSFDLELLLVKLDIEKERLLTWADLVGLSKSSEEGRRKMVDDKYEIVTRCLSSMHALFSDATRLKDQYGIKSDPVTKVTELVQRLSMNQTNAFHRSIARVRGLTMNRAPTLKLKTKWAIFDKDKFASLIDHVRDLVDGLHHIIPVEASEQHAMVANDIATLAVHEIKMVRDGCVGTYQAWSEIASAILVASETGTLEHRSVKEWIQDPTQMQPYPDMIDHILTADAHDTTPFDVSLPVETSIYFIFTADCLLVQTKRHCSALTIGQTAFRHDGISFLPEPTSNSFHGFHGQANILGKRITDSMQVDFDDEDIEMLRYTNFELGEIQNAVMTNKLLPLAVIHIYCGPCGCALRTALSVSRRQQSPTIDSWVRVDDRIDTTCCSQQDRLAHLRSILDMVKVLEAAQLTNKDGFYTDWVGRIDRLWLEKRIYILEDKLSGGILDGTRIQRGSELIAGFQPSLKGKKTAIVILGELGTCQWMIQNSPFPWDPRISKETEIYQLKAEGHLTWQRNFLGTFTPRDYHLTSKTSFIHRQVPSTLEPSLIPSPPPVFKQSRDSANHRSFSDINPSVPDNLMKPEQKELADRERSVDRES